MNSVSLLRGQLLLKESLKFLKVFFSSFLLIEDPMHHGTKKDKERVAVNGSPPKKDREFWNRCDPETASNPADIGDNLAYVLPLAVAECSQTSNVRRAK